MVAGYSITAILHRVPYGQRGKLPRYRSLGFRQSVFTRLGCIIYNILRKCMSVQYCACLHMNTGSLDSNKRALQHVSVVSGL